MKNILVVTNIPSYHQVDLFNEIAKNDEISLMVFYLIKKTVDRHWEKEFELTHNHKFLKTNYISQKRGLYYNLSILKELKSVNPDVIVLTQYANLTQQFILYFNWLFKSKVKLIFWSEKPGIPFYEAPIIKARGLRQIFRFLTLFPIIKNNNIRIWGIGKKAVEYYSNLVTSDVRNFPYFLNICRFLNSESRNFSKKIKVLYAGKFNDRKGFDILLEYLENSENEFLNNFEFTLIGTGDYIKRVKKLSLRNNIEFVPFVERQAMPKYFSASDVFLFPGRYDGWGMVINEAMANGLIVVSTPYVGAVEDLIEDEKNGLVIEGDVKSIQSKLEWIISNRNQLQSISEKAKLSANLNDVVRGSKLFLNMIDDYSESI